MAAERTDIRPKPRRFPAPLDLLVAGLGLGALGVYLGRGRIGGELLLIGVLGLDAAWLLVAWLRSREPRP